MHSPPTHHITTDTLSPCVITLVPTPQPTISAAIHDTRHQATISHTRHHANIQYTMPQKTFLHHHSTVHLTRHQSTPNHTKHLIHHNRHHSTHNTKHIPTDSPYQTTLPITSHTSSQPFHHTRNKSTPNDTKHLIHHSRRIAHIIPNISPPIHHTRQNTTH